MMLATVLIQTSLDRRGDWNSSPEEVASTGIVEAMKAKIIHADEATYVSGDASNEIVSFMISDVLAGAVVSFEVVFGSPNNKHVPIVLRLKATCLTQHILMIKTTPMYKFHDITSVAPEPVALMQEVEHKVSLNASDDISMLYEKWAALAEDELNSIHSVAAGAHVVGPRSSTPMCATTFEEPLHPKCDGASSCLRQICSCAHGYLVHRRNIFVARRFWIRALKTHPREAGDFCWAEVRQVVRIWPVLDDSSINEYIGIWVCRARKREDRVIQARVQSWTQWVNKSFAEKEEPRSSSSSRALLRRRPFWFPGSRARRSSTSTSPQQNMPNLGLSYGRPTRPCMM
jgi:hypothetical protein